MKNKEAFYNITTYDGSGNIAEKYEIKNHGWYNYGAVVVTLKNSKSLILVRPTIVIEQSALENSWTSPPCYDSSHKIKLYSTINNKPIKTWISRHTPAMPKFGIIFETKGKIVGHGDRYIQLHGSVVIEKQSNMGFKTT